MGSPSQLLKGPSGGAEVSPAKFDSRITPVAISAVTGTGSFVGRLGRHQMLWAKAAIGVLFGWFG